MVAIKLLSSKYNLHFMWLLVISLPPANKVAGRKCTPVCDSAYRGEGSLSSAGLCQGVSVQRRVYPGEVSVQGVSGQGRGSLSMGVSFQRGICPAGGGLSRGYLSNGLCPGESLSGIPRTVKYGKRAGGTHPTGIHSCYICYQQDENIKTYNTMKNEMEVSRIKLKEFKSKTVKLISKLDEKPKDTSTQTMVSNCNLVQVRNG